MSLTTEQSKILHLALGVSELDTVAMNSLVNTLDEDAKARLSAVLNAPISAPRVDKQDLILRALATLLRMAAADRLERVAAPYGDEHVARATKLITEIDGVVK